MQVFYANFWQQNTRRVTFSCWTFKGYQPTIIIEYVSISYEWFNNMK